MRESKLYNELLHDTRSFFPEQGNAHLETNLGDQDLHSALLSKHPELYYIFPCEWNLQLCRHWLNRPQKRWPPTPCSSHANWFRISCRCDTYGALMHGNCPPIKDQVKLLVDGWNGRLTTASWLEEVYRQTFRARQDLVWRWNVSAGTLGIPFENTACSSRT